MLIFIYKQFFASFFLFVEINVTIVSRKIFAIFVIKVCNLVVLISSSNLKFNKDDFNVQFRDRNSKKDFFLKNFEFLSSFLLLCFL